VFAPFPYDDIALKVGLALGTGLLVGLEREWAQKEVGVRTFAIISLFGTLTALTSIQLVIVALSGTFVLVGLMNVQSLMRDRSLEMTTSAALLVTLLAGALIGQGHYFTAITSSVLMTMLLAWKTELARFAGALQPEEIRSAVLLSLLSFVIYPLLPDRFVDPWQLLNPRQDWMIVVVIAGLGFANYVLLRLYETRGTYYAAFLGGLVNSTAAATELARLFRNSEDSAQLAVAVVMVTSVAMFLRNLIILAIFAPPSVGAALLPLGVMMMAALFMVWLHRDRSGGRMPQLHLSSPVSLPHVLRFGAMFVALLATGTLAERYLGSQGFLILAIVGGLVSSASTTATAATLVAAGKITPETAGIASVLTSMASALADLPLVYHQTHQKIVIRRLAGASAIILILGLSVLAFDRSEGTTLHHVAWWALESIRPAQ
jgi:uncharacterized membrane protein (DUF4010 family)